MTLLVADYGQALDGMEWRRLDLKVAGRAFVDLTDIKGMHTRQVFRAREVVDIWWKAKDRVYHRGRGYPEWVWRSVYQYLRICGEGGRAWRLMFD